MTAPFPFEAWARPGKDAFEFWISFFPTAPLFGVQWRFAGAMTSAKTHAEQADVPVPMPLPEAEPVAIPDDTPTHIDDETTDATAAIEEEVVAGDINPHADETPNADETAVIDPASEIASSDTKDAIKRAVAALAVETQPMAAVENAGASALSVETQSELELAEAETAIDASQPVQQAGEPLQTDPEAVDAAIAAAPRPKLLLAERPDVPDDLTTIKGIGLATERQLNDLGVWKLSQIARMTDADLAWIDAHLTRFKGRCFRDDWVGQAKARLDL